RIEVVGRQRERIQDREAFAIIQLAAHGRGALANRNAAILLETAHLDIYNAGLRFLANVPWSGVPPREHIVCRHSRMSDETHFSARCEEARTNAIVAVLRSQDECRIGVVELARNGEHLRFRETIRVEHNSGRVTGEAFAGESIDLVNLDLSCHELILNL